MAEWKTQPFLELPGRGRSVQLSSLAETIEQDVAEYMNEHTQELPSGFDDYTNSEKDTIEYVKSLMLAASETDTREKVWKDAWKGLFESGGFNQTISENNTGAFGLFAQNLLGLSEFFPKQGGSAQYPDIPKNKEFNDITGIELKTRYANLFKSFSLDVGEITASGGTISENPLTNDEINKLNSQYDDEKVLESIAINRLMDKMRTFLYIRVLNRKQQGELYHKRHYFPAAQATPFSEKAKRRRAGESGPNIEVQALILFMRLIIDKIKELVKRKGEGEFRINVKKTKEIKKGELIVSRTYDVELVRDRLWVSGDPATAVSKLIRELKFIRELYAQEFDFINQLEANRWRDARKFYAIIKNETVGAYKFKKF